MRFRPEPLVVAGDGGFVRAGSRQRPIINWYFMAEQILELPGRTNIRHCHGFFSSMFICMFRDNVSDRFSFKLHAKAVVLF